MIRRLLIGQYGHYDDQKQARDYRQDFYGMELCMFKSEKDIRLAIEQSKKLKCQLGVHFPLRAVKTLRDPIILSRTPEERDRAYQHIEDELAYVFQLFKPAYILFHFPKPVILSSDVDYSQWRFSDEREHVSEQAYSYDSFMADSQVFLEYISRKAQTYGFTPILELDALNSYMSQSKGFIGLLEQYPQIKICLDIARLHLQASMDKSFDPIGITKMYAPYTGLVHLSNGRLADNQTNNHYPALPDLRAEDGWADVEEYLQTINQVNNDYKLLFEHRSDRITDEQLDNCYQWISDIIYENTSC